MISVGIIANPASGQDIRRLTTQASVFGNDEKVRIVRRLLAGLAATGVERVWLMPDSYGIGPRALDGLRLDLDVRLLDMPVEFTQDDSTRAAAAMGAAGVRCLVTLGGDGTNRAVAKGCGATPLLPVSTGTNNVFPILIEATIGGIAAGLVATGRAGDAVVPSPRIEIVRGVEPPAPDAPLDNLALVDAAAIDEWFIGARAILDLRRVTHLVLARAEPGAVGMSSIGAHLLDTPLPVGQGLFLRLGATGQAVTAPVAPGLIDTVHVAEQRRLTGAEAVALRRDSAWVLAMDGERDLEVPPGETVWLRVTARGPRVIDPRRAIGLAAAAGVFVGPV